MVTLFGLGSSDSFLRSTVTGSLLAYILVLVLRKVGGLLFVGSIVMGMVMVVSVFLGLSSVRLFVIWKVMVSLLM